MTDGIPPPPVAKTLEEANEIIAMLWAEVHALRLEVAELKARLAQNSTNSSRPQSSDPPWKKRKVKRKPPKSPSGNKAGGQPGHKGRARKPVPPEEVDEVVDVVPEQCMICGAVLGEEVPGEDAFAHHVTELPPAKARVTEYRLWRKGSFGTQSDAGSLFVARMRTVIDTAKRRGVHFIDWLEQACRADTMNRSPPPLLLA